MKDRKWLTVVEVAERTGYNARYLQRLCQANAEVPPAQQRFRVDETPNGYLIWFPSFLEYMVDTGRKDIQES